MAHALHYSYALKLTTEEVRMPALYRSGDKWLGVAFTSEPYDHTHQLSYLN